jgi:hypothetical protein
MSSWKSFRHNNFANAARISLLAFISLLIQGCAVSTAQQDEDPSSCSSTEYQQFDFWVGEWDIHAAGTDQLIGGSSIQKKLNGCTIIENYRSLNAPYTGTSLSFFDNKALQWRQTWIDHTGSAIYFSGMQVKPGVMHMQDMTQKDFLKRVTWKKLPSGDVRQVGERSTDGGISWFIVFDGIYRPIGEESSHDTAVAP